MTKRMKFKFKAKRSNGEIIDGIREESDRFKLSHQLVAEGLFPISIIPVQNGRKYDFEFFNEIFIRVKLAEKIIFAKNLGSMLNAGLPLSRALQILERETENIKLKKIIKSILEDVEAGKSLSQSMSRFPGVFSSLFIAMVEAGEESGSLPDSLKIVSDQLDKVYAIRRKITSAMVYPSVILVAMLIIGALMLIYVVPNLTGTFKEFGAELPLSTRIIIEGSDFLIAHVFAVIFIVISLIAILYAFFSSLRGQKILDYVLLRMPLISGIVRQSNSATTARTISSLVSSGVPIVKSLEITSDVLQNYYYKEAMSKAVVAIQKGDSLSNLFKKETKLYPSLMGEMSEVGEETGNLPKMLMNVAVFYEAEVDAVTKDMSTIVEPFLMLVIGLAVGFFAVAMIQPIYSLSAGV